MRPRYIQLGLAIVLGAVCAWELYPRTMDAVAPIPAPPIEVLMYDEATKALLCRYITTDTGLWSEFFSSPESCAVVPDHDYWVKIEPYDGSQIAYTLKFEQTKEQK